MRISEMVSGSAQRPFSCTLASDPLWIDTPHTSPTSFYFVFIDKRLLIIRNPSGSPSPFISVIFCAVRKKSWSTTAVLLFWRALYLPCPLHSTCLY